MSLLRLFPAVGLVGSRQVGKTTFVREGLPPDPGGREDVYVDLENPRDAAMLQDPLDYLERRSDKRIIIDEVQLRPDLFSVLRPVIDADRRPGRFVLLGSASPSLIRGASESLAGRIGYIELTPLTRAETQDYDELAPAHWLRGGYPSSLLASSAEDSELWRLNYLEAYITRELPLLAPVLLPNVMRTLLSMLAGQQGDLVNFSALSRAIGVLQATVKSYLKILEQSYLLRVLPPYAVDVRKRLVKAPKIYIRDSGLLHALLGIDDEDQLTSSVAVGGSWEGYAVEQIISSLSSRVRAYFYRTHAGAELDLVLEGRRGRLAVVEVKRSSAPKLSRGFYNARTDLGPELSLVVAPVSESYSLGDGVEVVSLGMAQELLEGW